MITKLAHSIDMSFDIPASEKKIGQEAANLFNSIVNLIGLAKDHLDIMYNPFKKFENISTESLVKKRGKLNIFKQQVKKNFEEIKLASFYSVKKLNYFSIDSHTQEIINSFKESVNELEKQVVILLDVLDDYQSKEFRDNILSAIESIRSECADLEKLIKDRVLPHIEDNILASSWVNDTSVQLNDKIEERIPMITELFNERQKVLEETHFPAINKRPQSLNPSDAQKVHHPTDLRQDDTGI